MNAVKQFMKALCELKQRFQFLNEYVFGNRTNAFVHDFSILEEQDGGYIPDSIFHADVSVVIHVHFAHYRSTVLVVC